MLKTKKKILLIPYFWDQDLYKQLKKESLKTHKIYFSEHLIFDNYSIITGFLGYPQILSLLNIIDINEKEFFFLGTAGSLNKSIIEPVSINITDIYSSSIYKLFSKAKILPLNIINNNQIKKGTCVSVDIPMRETKNWLKTQRKQNIDAVEMEIFPIRVFIKKPLTAIIIITDKVSGNKNIKLMNKKLIKNEFFNSFNMITNLLNK